MNDMDNVRVEQLGGKVHRKSCSTMGESAERALTDMVCSKFFLGVDGIDPDYGITTSTIEEALLSRRMMDVASRTVVLADSSKFGQHGFGRINALEDVDVIITDSGIPQHTLVALQQRGIEVSVIGP